MMCCIRKGELPGNNGVNRFTVWRWRQRRSQMNGHKAEEIDIYQSHQQDRDIYQSQQQLVAQQAIAMTVSASVMEKQEGLVYASLAVMAIASTSAQVE